MKKLNCFKHTLIAVAAITSAAMVTGCSDWDDHYDANSEVSGNANATLWQNIKSNANLSQFADLLQKAGYDEVLNQDQNYTVFAPLNDTFNYDSLSQISVSSLRKEFIANHVARFNYPVSGSVSETITMLNTKVAKLAGDDSYTIANVTVDQPNVASSNGTMHVIGGKIPFRYNIYESLNTDHYALDSISNYIHKYDVEKLDESKSVEGPTLNGHKTYLDSVMYTRNDITLQLGALINNEDSSYTVIAPTNTAFRQAVGQYTPYFNYVPSMIDVTVPAATTAETTKETVNLNSAYLTDSLVKMNIVRDMFFSNNVYHNSVLNSLNEGETLNTDSIESTTQGIFYGSEAAQLFKGATKSGKSNGNMWITDSWNYPIWVSVNPAIKFEFETSAFQANSANAQLTTVSAAYANKNADVPGRVSSNRYLQMDAIQGYPSVYFYLPNVLSTTYYIYAVVVPANYISASVTDVLPNLLRAQVGYNNASGKDITSTRIQVETDPTKVDTVQVAKITFPIAYYGTGTHPYLMLQTRGATSSYDRSVRLDCILLVPEELKDYKDKHPEYEIQYNKVNFITKRN